jgi:hypothetical protein
MVYIMLRNATDKQFVDISSELWRSYEFPDGHLVIINRPQWLSVSESGGARILDIHGVCHYIPCGWIHLRWEVFHDAPHFVC